MVRKEIKWAFLAIIRWITSQNLICKGIYKCKCSVPRFFLGLMWEDSKKKKKNRDALGTTNK